MSGPENIVLVQLREMRREFTVVLESHVGVMHSVKRVYERLEQFHDDIARLSGDLSAFRQEARKGALKLEGDLVHLEIQNISRHGEMMNLIRRMDELAEDAVEAN